MLKCCTDHHDRVPPVCYWHRNTVMPVCVRHTPAPPHQHDIAMAPYARVSLVLSALVLAGCGLSVVPISEVADAPVDTSLVGVWRDLDPESTAEFLVLKWDENNYYVELWIEPELPADEIGRFRAYTSVVEGTNFLNLQYLAESEEDRVYSFLTYARNSDGTLHVGELNDVADQKIDDFTSSADLRAFVRANVDNDQFYGPVSLWAKVGDDRQDTYPEQRQ